MDDNAEIEVDQWLLHVTEQQRWNADKYSLLGNIRNNIKMQGGGLDKNSQKYARQKLKEKYLRGLNKT